MKSKYAVKPHIKPLYDLLMQLLRPYLWIKYSFRAPRDIPAMPEGPIVLLGSHTGNLDFLFALATVRKKRFHGLVAAHFYRNKRIAWLLNTLRCIRKEQFRADVESIARMKNTIESGESLLIYPEGEVNGTGRTESSNPSIARLAKLLKAPLYAARTHGGYFTRPKWNPVQRKGKVEIEIELIATAEEVKSLSNDELYKRIEEKIKVDDYAWQKQRMIPFGGKNRAHGLSDLLYLCPKCGGECTTVSDGDEICCTRCGNKGIMDEYGFLHPADSSCVIPETVPEWADIERDALRREIADDNFALSAPCYLQYHLDPKTTFHTDVGHGTVTLTHTDITYEGTAEGEQIRLSFPHGGIYKFPFNMGHHFDIPNTVRTISIRPDNPQLNEKFVLALPLIHEYTEAKKLEKNS